MKPFPRPRMGYTLIEMILVLVLLGLLVGVAVPRVRRQIQQIYVRGALNQVVAEVYRTRMLAVASGSPARLILAADANGCVKRVHVRVEGEDSLRNTAIHPTLPGLCLRHSGDSILTFNSRGMLRPPSRSFHVSYGAAADSVLLSIAGRVRRTY